MQHGNHGSARLVREPGARLNALERRLEQMGIPTMPRAYVKRHQTKMLKGALGERYALNRAVISTMVLLRVMALRPLITTGEDRFAGMIGAMFVAGIALSFFSPVFWMLAIPVLASACYVGMTLAFNGAGILARWVMEPPGTYHIVPIALHNLQQKVVTVPTIQLFVEAFDKDPFLVTVCGWGPCRQRAYVAGWNTGDTLIDNFAG